VLVPAPEFVGTGAQGILKHSDRGTELMPNDGFPSFVHFSTSGSFYDDSP